MSALNRLPLETVNTNRESYYSSQSSQKVSSTIRQVTSTTSNMQSSYMKRSMSGTNIYGSQMNSPPLQRQNLGKNMDVVCFLLACEVERFVAENDKLKYRIKEMDDKLLDRNSYEKQIEDLQERLMQYQYQESMYRQEIEMTSTTITTLSSEMESWKTRYFQAEDKQKSSDLNQQKQIDNLKAQLLQGDQRRQAEIEDLKAQNQNLRHSYESELNRQRDLYQNEISQLELSLRQYKLTDEKLRDYENKIGLLVCETERLNGLLKSKLEELESLKSRSQMLVSDLEKSNKDYRSLQAAFDRKSRDYDQLNQQYILNQNELAKYKDQDQIVEQLQNKLALLTGEIERLNQVLRDKINQGEEWRAKYFTADNNCNELKQRLQKLDQLQGQLKDYLDKVNFMGQSLDEMKAKNIQLTQKLEASEHQNQEYCNRIALLTQEIERLNSISKQKIHELEEYKQKCQYLESELKQKLNQATDLKNKLTSLSSEIDRLQDLLQHKNQELLESQRNSQQYLKDLSNQEQLHQQLIRTIEEWKRKYSSLEREYIEAQQRNKQIQEYENNIALLTQEIERLNQVLQNKLLEFDESRRLSLQELSRYKQQLSIKSSECEEWMQKYRRIELQLQEQSGQNKLKDDKIVHYQTRVILHCAEIDRLGSIQSELFDETEQLQTQIQQYQNQLKQKDDQLYKALERNNSLQKLVDEEKSRRQQLELTISNLRVYQENCTIFEQKITMLSTELNRVNEQLRSRSGEVEEYRSQITRYENKITLLSSEIERLNILIKKQTQEQEERRREHDRLEQQYQLILRQYEELKQKYMSMEIYKQKSMDLENKCAMLSTELERLQQLLNQRNDEMDALKRKCFSLEQTIVQLRQYEENVRILSNEIDRLQGIIDQQDGELRTWRLQYADGGALKQKVQDQLIHFVMMSAEIESLRARVQEKEREVEEVRRSSLAPYRR